MRLNKDIRAYSERAPDRGPIKIPYGRSSGSILSRPEPPPGVTPNLPTNIIPTTVSFHNFKSQNFKLSVSNPKSKYVAYSSVLSRISNCQGLGRKNKLKF